MKELSLAEMKELNEIIPEQELIELFGVNKTTMSKWRKRGLKYCKMSTTQRFYFVRDVISFLHEHRVSDV